MLKNPNCPSCRDNKRVIAGYKIPLHRNPLDRLLGKETFKCNACGAGFSGIRTDDPDKQMERIMEAEQAKREAEAETSAADNPEPEVVEKDA